MFMVVVLRTWMVLAEGRMEEFSLGSYCFYTPSWWEPSTATEDTEIDNPLRLGLTRWSMSGAGFCTLVLNIEHRC